MSLEQNRIPPLSASFLSLPLFSVLIWPYFKLLGLTHVTDHISVNELQTAGLKLETFLLQTEKTTMLNWQSGAQNPSKTLPNDFTKGRYKTHNDCLLEITVRRKNARLMVRPNNRH